MQKFVKCQTVPIRGLYHQLLRLLTYKTILGKIIVLYVNKRSTIGLDYK